MGTAYYNETETFATGAFAAQCWGSRRAKGVENVSKRRVTSARRARRCGENQWHRGLTESCHTADDMRNGIDDGGGRGGGTKACYGDEQVRSRSRNRRKGWFKRWLKMWINIAVLDHATEHDCDACVEEDFKTHRAGVLCVTGGGPVFARGCVRFGEARHPGPQVGRNERKDGFSITTGNGTGWGTILNWISGHHGHVICAQEHNVMHLEDVVCERGRALARGWKTIWSPAVPSGSEANEASGGAVVLVRAHIGVDIPPGGEVVVPGHVAAAMVETASLGWTVIYSVYGKCGDELGARNWAICEAIACHAIGHGLPWCAAGDWNFEPATLRSSDGSNEWVRTY